MRGLLDEQEQLDWTSWVVPTAQFKISYFHYCTYNPFRSVDVHLETQKMRGDGDDEDMNFDIYAVDKNGRRSPVQRDDTALWKELRIAGVLRYMARQLGLDSFDPKITPLQLNDDCLTSFSSREFLGLPDDENASSTTTGATAGSGSDSISASASSSRAASRSSSRINLSVDGITPVGEQVPISLVGPMCAEEAFLEFLVPFLQSGLLLGSYTRGSTTTIVNNLMVQVPFKYMLRQGCSNIMIDWACRMSIDVPEMLSLEAKARRKTPVFVDPAKKASSPQDDEAAQSGLNGDEDHTNCVNALLQAVSQQPNSLDMLIELSVTLLTRGERQKAIEYAKLAVEQHPDDFRALYAAAKVFALTNQPELALSYLFTSPVVQPPPSKDLVGAPFHRYATEPHYDYPNADQIRRIEEVDLAQIEESEADLMLTRANLNKIERQYYRLFHTIVKISGRDILVKLIRERAPKIRDSQEKARLEQRKAKEEEEANRPPPRNRRVKSPRKPATSSETSSRASSTAHSRQSSTASVESSSASSASSSAPVSPRSIVPPSNIQPDVPSSASPAEFTEIEMNQSSPPLAWHLDVSYDTLRHSYLSLMDDLRTVERYFASPTMSVAGLVRLGLIHKRLGAYDLALESFETALTIGWSFTGCRELCFLHVQIGKVRQALECADRSLRHLTHRWGTSYPDWQLRSALWRIVSRKGLKHVLHILENLQEVNDWHPFLRRCLEDAPYHLVDNSAL